jgi:hypothetical protein
MSQESEHLFPVCQLRAPGDYLPIPDYCLLTPLLRFFLQRFFNQLFVMKRRVISVHGQ